MVLGAGLSWVGIEVGTGRGAAAGWARAGRWAGLGAGLGWAGLRAGVGGGWGLGLWLAGRFALGYHRWFALLNSETEIAF